MPLNVLCGVCRVEEHEELIEPVITSCGHLFCWPCLYSSVKTAARDDYPCPMCRLLVSAVTSDLSRGKFRAVEQVLQSRIPRRPGQGIFPFYFDLAATGQDMNNDADVQPETSGVQLGLGGVGLTVYRDAVFCLFQQTPPPTSLVTCSKTPGLKHRL